MDKTVLLLALAGVGFLGYRAWQNSKAQGPVTDGGSSSTTGSGSAYGPNGGDPAFSIGNAIKGGGLSTDPRTVQCQKYPSLCIGDPRWM